MSTSDWLRDALQTEASGMEMPHAMPNEVRRSVRRRRLGTAASAAALVTAAIFGTTALPDLVGEKQSDVAGRPDDLEAGRTLGAIQTTDPELIAEGRDFEVNWQLVVSKGPDGPCLELQIDRRPEFCYELGDGYSRNFEVSGGHAESANASFVFGTIPENGSGVWIDLKGGGRWAALIFEGEENDGRDYFVRVFSEPEVEGTLAREEGPPVIRFSLTDDDATSFVAVGSDPFPTDVESSAGESETIYTDPTGEAFTDPGTEGEPFDVVMETTEDEICLHIEGAAECTPLEGLTDGLRLSIAEHVGDSVVIGGLVGSDVEEVTIVSNEDRYPQQLSPHTQLGVQHRSFVFQTSFPFDGHIEVLSADGSTSQESVRVR